MNKRIEDAEEQYKMAAVSLVRIIETEYPLGTEVNVTFGRGSFNAEIIGYSAWWSGSPTYVTGWNVNTGKRRNFPVSAINYIAAPAPDADEGEDG